MNILVTGGAGFIGSNFVFLELKEHLEDRIICVDKLTYAGNLKTLKDVMDNPQFVFYKTDVKQLMKSLPRKDLISLLTSQLNLMLTVLLKTLKYSLKQTSSVHPS